MPLSLTPSLARRLVSDPVKAAWVLMGIKLDVFQQAKLILWWFTPNVMDHSGVSTGKTELLFIWAFLRLQLLPLNMLDKHRIIAVYYISQGTAEQTFLPKVEEYVRRSKLFENELKIQRGRKFYVIKKNVIVIEMKNGGRLELPAGDFMKDSENQASKRFNDLALDEGALIETKGKGVDEQLMQRNTQESFNPYHPLHCNHTLFLGHAEDPSHPYHKRYLAMKREYSRRSSQDTVTITSSFKDYKGEFREKYAIQVQRKYDTDKGRLDHAKLANIYDGLWLRGSRGLYSSTMRDGIETISVKPMLRRYEENQSTIFSLGWDSATSLSPKSDFNYGVIWAADEVSVIPNLNEPGYMRIGNKLWFVRAVWAANGLGWDVDQRSGVIHLLDSAFGFSVVVLDSQGGGADLYKKLREKRQFMNNKWTALQGGLCSQTEGNKWPEARAIVHFYDRGDPLFREEFGTRWVADQTGPIDYMHRQITAHMRSGGIAWPASYEKRGLEDRASMSPDQLKVLETLDSALDQYNNIKLKVDKAKNPVVSEKGFQKFAHTGKKDGAMASNYGLLGLIAKLNKLSSAASSQESSETMEIY